MFDVDVICKLVSFFELLMVVIIKYNNFCGVGIGDMFEEVYQWVLVCDLVFVFGLIIVVN